MFLQHETSGSLVHSMPCTSLKHVAISNYYDRYLLGPLMHRSAQTTPCFSCVAYATRCLFINHCVRTKSTIVLQHKLWLCRRQPLSGDANARQDIFQTHRSSRSTSASAAPMVSTSPHPPQPQRLACCSGRPCQLSDILFCSLLDLSTKLEPWPHK